MLFLLSSLMFAGVILGIIIAVDAFWREHRKNQECKKSQERERLKGELRAEILRELRKANSK